LGGTFDPPHYAHLAIAEEARVRLGLAQVIFAPAAGNPLKADRPTSPARHRLAMTHLAVQDNPHFAVSERDLECSPSYSVDLLTRLHADMPDSELYFIIGIDALAKLTRWREPGRILELAHMVGLIRPGNSLDFSQLYAALPSAHERVTILTDGPLLDISSTELRRRVAALLSIRYQLPDAVIAYIAAESLYRAV